MSSAPVLATEQLHHFVLVHGACHGAWCWYKVRTQLEKHGHKVTCIDLAGAGINPSDPIKVSPSFPDYNRPLLDFLESLPTDEKVILVGHSIGGFNVTYSIHKIGERIKLAVYLAAAMTKFNIGKPPHFSDEDVIYTRDGLLPTSVIFKEEALPKLLYNRSPEEDINLAAMLMRPCPFVFLTAVAITGKYVDKVRRVYVKTLDDHLMKMSDQEDMIKGWPPAEVFEVDSDHSAFCSAPNELSSILLKAASNIPD